MIWITVSFGGKRIIKEAKGEARSEAAREALLNRWSPRTHSFFPTPVKQSILWYSPSPSSLSSISSLFPLLSALSPSHPRSQLLLILSFFLVVSLFPSPDPLNPLLITFLICI